MRKTLFNPLFWILVLFAVRLENYPTNTAHDDFGWRSSFTGMVSRNMLEISPNPFWPHIDHAIDRSDGLAACEFPVFNGLQFLAFKTFGYAKWYGRFINLCVSSLGLWFFFCLARRLLKNEAAALAAMLFLATSIWFNFSRRNMPDTFALSLALMAAEIGWRFLEKGGGWRLALFFALCTAGLLSKMPAACALPVLAAPVIFNEKLSKSRKISLVSVGLVAAGLMAAWYFWWVPHLETIGLKLTWPETFANGWKQITGEFAGRTWKQFWHNAFQSEFVWWLSVAGLAFSFWRKNWPLVAVTGIWAAVSAIFILKAGFIFSTHDYYTVPLAPVMAILAANAFSALSFSKKDWLIIAVALAAAGVSAKKQLDWFSKPTAADLSLNRLEGLVDQVVPKGAPVVANDYNFSPTIMFWAHRRGLTLDNGSIVKPGWLSGKCDQGIDWCIVSKHILSDSLPFAVALDDAEFRIYRLRKTGE